MKYFVFLQEWEESERGWGTRPDGYFVFLSPEAAKSGTQLCLQNMRAKEAEIYKGEAPESYSRPCGNPFPVETCEEYYHFITEICSKNLTGYMINHKTEIPGPEHFPK